MAHFESFLDEGNNNIIQEQPEQVELYQQQDAEQKRLKKVKHKIKHLQKKLTDTHCVDKKQQKKYKKKIKRYKNERCEIQRKLTDIEQRICQAEKSISLMKADILELKKHYKQHIIQKIANSNDTREIERYLKILEGGSSNDKYL